jgi:hypothetical protein
VHDANLTLVPAGSYHCTVVDSREGILQLCTGGSSGECVTSGCVRCLGEDLCRRTYPIPVSFPPVAPSIHAHTGSLPRYLRLDTRCDRASATRPPRSLYSTTAVTRTSITRIPASTSTSPRQTSASDGDDDEGGGDFGDNLSYRLQFGLFRLELSPEDKIVWGHLDLMVWRTGRLFRYRSVILWAVW